MCTEYVYILRKEVRQPEIYRPCENCLSKTETSLEVFESIVLSSKDVDYKAP